MHFRDMAAYEDYRAWFADHPIPIERGPAGRTHFTFYLLAEVAEATRAGLRRSDAGLFSNTSVL